jgi:hypothetical protein
LLELNDADFKDLPKLNSSFLKNSIDDFTSILKLIINKIIFFAKYELEMTQLKLSQSDKSAKEELFDLNQNIKLLIYAINEGTELLDPCYTYENNINNIVSNIDNICKKMNVSLE